MLTHKYCFLDLCLSGGELSHDQIDHAGSVMLLILTGVILAVALRRSGGVRTGVGI
jgi:hypothetical protein